MVFLTLPYVRFYDITNCMFNPLISPFDIQQKLPLSLSYKQVVLQHRKTAENIIRSEDERFVIFAGPCSIHDKEIALKYASHLKELSKKVEDRIFLIMRVFLEKPRSQFGWKGYIYDPYLDGSSDVEHGLFLTRELLLKLMEFELPLSTEFLDPFLCHYHQEFFTWGMIGARTSASQIHRQMASHLPLPIGFKNETDGMLDNAICGALTAHHPQTSLGIDPQGKISLIRSQGNPFTHLVLRGSNIPNYDAFSLSQAIQRQRVFGLSTPLIIDCAHGNSEKNSLKQKEVFHNVILQLFEGNDLIMGTMLESHLEEGNAMSITDPCIGWKVTEELVLNAYEMLASGFCARTS